MRGIWLGAAATEEAQPVAAGKGRHLFEPRGFGASLATPADDGTGDRGGRVTQALPGGARHRLEAVHTDVWGR